MTQMELFKELSDLEFKVYSFTNLYNEGRERKLPVSPEYIAAKLDKSKRTIERAQASLKVRGLI